MLRQSKFFIGCALICFVFFANQTAFANNSNFQTSQIFFTDRYFRTELYFGTDKPDGGKVSAEDWDKFLETEVIVRFPDGFTLLEGYGQYKDGVVKIVREASKVLVLFYPKKLREAVNPKIEELRETIKNSSILDRLYGSILQNRSKFHFNYLTSEL